MECIRTVSWVRYARCSPVLMCIKAQLRRTQREGCPYDGATWERQGQGDICEKLTYRPCPIYAPRLSIRARIASYWSMGRRDYGPLAVSSFHHIMTVPAACITVQPVLPPGPCGVLTHRQLRAHKSGGMASAVHKSRDDRHDAMPRRCGWVVHPPRSLEDPSFPAMDRSQARQKAVVCMVASSFCPPPCAMLTPIDRPPSSSSSAVGGAAHEPAQGRRGRPLACALFAPGHRLIVG